MIVLFIFFSRIKHRIPLGREVKLTARHSSLTRVETRTALLSPIRSKETACQRQSEGANGALDLRS